MGMRMTCPTFIGRADELTQLDAALASLTTEGAATVLIGGEAGIGKTRLVAELRRRAGSRGLGVASGFCSPIDGRGRPYGPFAGILRELSAGVGGRPAAAALEPVSRALGLGSPAAPDPDHAFAPWAGKMAKTTLFDLILGGVSSVAGDSGLLLVFEDLHWSDSASIDLFDFLARSLGRSPVVLAGTYRSDELDPGHPLRPMITELARHRRVLPIALEGLDRTGTAALVEAMLGGPPDAALCDAVFFRSGGNPFHAEELTAARDLAVVPPRVQDLILLRAQRLSPAARTVLTTMAAVGEVAGHELLAAVCHEPPDRLDAALGEAIERRLIQLDPAEQAYRFPHALVRDVLYATLLPGERARLHRRVAECLTARPGLLAAGPGSGAAELAGHWWAAGEWAEALAASATAAAVAGSVFAFGEALAHLERALLSWERVPDASSLLGIDHAELLARAADAAYFGSTSTRAVELAHAAVQALDAGRDPGRAALGWARLGRNLFPTNVAGAVDALDHALACLPPEGASLQRARVLAEKAAAVMGMSRFTDAAAVASEALATARAVGGRAEEGHALVTLGCCAASMSRPEDGIGLVREGLDIAESIADPDLLNRGYVALSYALFQAGRFEDAAAVTLDAVAVGQQLWGIRLEGAALNSIEALIHLGRLDEAEAMLSERGHVQGPCGFGWFELVSALIGLRRGRQGEAARLLSAPTTSMVEEADVQLAGWYHVLRAQLALQDERYDDATAALDRALELAASTDDEVMRPEMYALAIRALADAQDAAATRRRWTENRREKARLAAAGLAEEADRLIAAPALRGGACAPQQAAFGLLCRAEESRLERSDPSLWQAAAEAWDVLRMPYHGAYCRWRQAEALLGAGGGRRLAADELARAWRASREMGAGWLADRVERLAQRARIVLPGDDGGGRPSLASDLGLTAREVEVLGQLAAGRTDAQIAEQLFISKKTASVHVSNLLRKLGVDNRYDAGAVGRQVGVG